MVALALAGCGPASVQDNLRDYDRLVELARAASTQDPDLPAFRLGMSALPDDAKRLMLDLDLYSVATTDDGWAWARGRGGLVQDATVYTLIPAGEESGQEVVARSRHGGLWVRGLHFPQ